MDGNDKAKTVIAEDVEIQGSIKCAGNIQLDGKLNGDMNCNGNAVIGASANVKGNISVESVSVLGQINGNITAKDRIELKSTARLNGDIRAKRLTVEDGVSFVGKSEVNPSGGARPTPGETRAAETNDEAEDEQAANETQSDENRGKGGIFGKR